MAFGAQGAHELCHEGSQRNRDAGLAGRGRDDAEVFVVQVHAKARFEAAGDHVRGLAVENAVAGQAAGKHRDGGRGVDLVGFEKDQRLGHQLDGSGHDELVGGFHGLAAAAGAHVHDGAADGVEQRAHGGNVGRVTAEHDREGALHSAGFAARDGGVKRMQARGDSVGGQAYGDVGTDGARVDPVGTRGGVGEDAVGAGDDGLDVGGVGQHRDDDLGIRHGLLDARGADAALRDEGVDFAGAAVVAGHGVAGGDQVEGHGQAHDAEADDSNVGHVGSLVRGWGSRGVRRRGRAWGGAGVAPTAEPGAAQTRASQANGSAAPVLYSSPTGPV